MNSSEKSGDLVTVNGKRFRQFLTEAKLQKRIRELGGKISTDFPDGLLLVGVLKGSYVFLADLARNISSPTQVDFVKISSYGDKMESSGNLNYQLDLTTDIAGRNVLVVEDIVDSGRTIAGLMDSLGTRGPKSLSIVALLHKPDATIHKLKIDYVGFEIPSRFVVGYGLDYAEFGRQLRHIYVLDEPE